MAKAEMRAVWMMAGAAAVAFAQGPAVFEATVRDSVTRQPVARAVARLRPGSTESPTYSGDSDNSGKLRFDAVTPGRYSLDVQRRGYVSAHLVDIGAHSTTNVFVLEAGRTVTGATVWLEPEAVVTGRVADVDGEPAADAHVSAVSEQWDRGQRILRQVGYAEADDRGGFRMTLPAGRYYFKARVNRTAFADAPGRQEMRVVDTFYPAGPSIETATAVEVAAGAQASGIDMRLAIATAYRVRGVLDPPVTNSNAIVYLWNRNGDRTPGATFGTQLEKDGTFRIAGVPPGRYWLEIPPIRFSPTGRMAVDVTDRDIDKLKFPVRPDFELKGRVRVEDGAEAPAYSTIRVLLDQINFYQLPIITGVSANDAGEFAVKNVRLGEYVVSIAAEGDYYMQSVSANHRSSTSGKLDLTNGPPGDLEIVLGTGAGQINGTVQWPDSPGPARLWSAILVSESGETGDTRARREPIDDSGRFEFHSVPPGSWRVFVTGEPALGVWGNMDFVKQIASRGKAVDLAKKATETVEVSPVSADDFRNALEKVRR